MSSPHHPHHQHHDVHQQRLLWFFSFCNQRSSSSSNSSSAGSTTSHNSGRRSSRRKSAASRNKFALQYQQQLLLQQRQSSNVFGLDLIEHTQRFSDEDSIPHIVKSCTRFIEKHGIIFGIYRLSGMRVNIHKLRQDFDKNPKISMIDNEAISNDAHAVACVLKQYFRELPTPLLTFHMYEKFIELFKQDRSKIRQPDQNYSRLTKQQNNPGNNLESGCESATGDHNKLRDSVENEFIESQQLDETKQDIRTKSADTSCVNRPGDNLKEHEALESDKAIKSTSDETPKHGAHMTSSADVGGATSITKQPAKSKLLAGHLQSSTLVETKQRGQKQFTSSVSDSQLLTLSSVVTTTTSDITYHVNLDELRKLLFQLPRAHYQTLKFLMRHLACIAANGQKTGMDSKNVAIVWAPNLLKPRELELSAGLETLQVIGLQAVITEQLIKHHKFLFDGSDEEYVTK